MNSVCILFKWGEGGEGRELPLGGFSSGMGSGSEIVRQDGEKGVLEDAIQTKT